jgi:hypothetical protein
MRKFLPLILFGLLTGVGAVGAYAAEPTPSNPMKAVFEMSKNIAWTVDGLYRLGKTSDRTLKLTKTQAKKILPIYKELIAKKIIRLEMKKGFGGPPRDGKTGPKARQPGGAAPPPKAHPQDSRALVAFGNAQMEAINRILTKKQVELIDNLDFDAEKYGFPNHRKVPAGPNGGPPPNGKLHGGPPPGKKMSEDVRQRPDQELARPRDPKFKAGRKRLVRLYRDVLKMLQNMK